MYVYIMDMDQDRARSPFRVHFIDTISLSLHIYIEYI